MPSSAIIVGEAILLLVAGFVFWYWYNRNRRLAEEKKHKDTETYKGGLYAETKLKCANEDCALHDEVENYHDITPQDLIKVLKCSGCGKQREIISQTQKKLV